MKKIILLLIYVSIILSVFSQKDGTASISGTVLKSFDQITPIWGASVYAICDDFETQITETNAVGEYEFIELEVIEGGLGSNYQFVSVKSGFVNGITNWQIHSGDNIEDTIYMIQYGIINGKVTLEDYNFGDTTKVSISFIDGEDIIKTVNLDVDGNYTSDTIPPADYTVEAFIANFVTIEYIREIIDGDTLECNFDLELIPSEIKGRVTIEEGEGNVQDVVVSLKKDGTQQATTKPESSGSYSFDELILGEYTISASLYEYIPSDILTVLVDQPGQINEENNIRLVPAPILTITDEDNFVFEEIVDNTSEVQSFSVSGKYFEEALKISVEDPFEISNCINGNFSKEVIIQQNDTGVIVDSTIYVRFVPNAVGAYSKDITFESVYLEELLIALSGESFDQLVIHEIHVDQDNVCRGTIVELIAEVSGGIGELSYYWNGSDEASSETCFGTVYIDSAFLLRVEDAKGNWVQEEKNIYIYKPVEFADSLQDGEVCEGEKYSFSTEIVNANEVSYQWFKNGGLISDNELLYSGAQTKKLDINSVKREMDSNKYYCEVTRCDSEKETNSAVLQVNRKPDTTLINKDAGSSMVLISPDSGLVYQWYLDEMPMPGENNQFLYLSMAELIASEGAPYCVGITNNAGCYQKTNKYSHLIEQKNALHLFPNPIENQLNVSIKGMDLNNASILMSDLMGRILINKKISNQQSLWSYSVSALKPGIYIVEIIDGEGEIIYSSKVVKQ